MSEDQTNKQPRKKGKTNVEQSIFALNINSTAQAKVVSRIALAVEILAGSFFYVVGDDLTNWGYVTWGWFFHYLVLCSAALLLADVIFKFWPRRSKIWVGFGMLCVALLILYCWLSPGPTKPALSQNPAFRVSVGSWMQSDSIERPALWLVQSGKNGELVRCRASALMWIKLVNTQPFSCMIDSYGVEEDHGGRWDTAAELDLRYGQLFFASTSLQTACPLNCRANAFNSVLDSKNIGPHETVQGWILFRSPVFGNLRLRIKETSGNECVTAFERVVGAQATNLSVQVQASSLNIPPGGKKDISNLREPPFGDTIR